MQKPGYQVLSVFNKKYVCKKSPLKGNLQLATAQLATTIYKGKKIDYILNYTHTHIN